jgi:hypothetical protein
MAMSWRGPEVIARVQRAARIGINKTMTQAVLTAKNEHPWRNRTGTAERSIRVASPAKTIGNETVGIWGSLQVGYFIGLERGNPAHLIRARRKKALSFEAGGKDIVVRSVRHPGNKPMPILIPTARKVHPRLAQNIKEAWKRA